MKDTLWTFPTTSLKQRISINELVSQAFNQTLKLKSIEWLNAYKNELALI
ncbi:hypothetical protein VCRA2126O85_80058 [Vibrio crassostreae]|nr:hypothetical protein VCRA2110O182_10372 [Vibrio crassostreae]CAK2295810.1 hypothetical protein VCRA2111O408_10503 [Vibrio crassostreae]CAK2306337.1 hypothetical protein VCRA211O406_10371 [Vibrio crassostreae]CAK2450220.1 hypothetical protein VCRA2113O415_240025 [Vibrio crassostreae]CAK2714336.1 hypothetical protein VCRA2113O420_260050 [Vibrio crassostreae]